MNTIIIIFIYIIYKKKKKIKLFDDAENVSSQVRPEGFQHELVESSTSCCKKISS